MQTRFPLALALFASACTGELALDDDANAIDELTPYVATPPTMIYSRTRPSETQTYPQLPSLRFRMSDPAQMTAVNGTLFTPCQLEYQPLAKASGATTTITT